MRIVQFDSCNTFAFAINFDAYDYQIKQIHYCNGADNKMILKYMLLAVNHSDGASFTLYSSINEDSVRYLLYCIILDYVNGEKICNLAVHINDATNPNCVAVGMTDEYAQKLVARSHTSNY